MLRGKLKKILIGVTAAALLAGVVPVSFAGTETQVQAAVNTYTVKVASGYLALRSAPSFNASNEIGKLYTGETVEVQDYSGQYWWVYSPKLNRSGYVNSDYLYADDDDYYYSGTAYKVSLSIGYLALRSAKVMSSSNEIGRLYNGETVYVQDSSDGTYWYVYSPKLDMYGYVNRKYLAGAGSGSSQDWGTSYTVSVPSSYLALRTANAFNSANEIGKLWTGDIVKVQDTSDSTYWWVYAPTLGKSGYVNKNYLAGAAKTMTVKVATGYLALRNAKGYYESNEIGALYTGDKVHVMDQSDGTYWWVYSPKLNKSGYVNKNYLY